MDLRFKRPADALPDDTYVELVRSLFQTLLPASIMGILFIGVAVLVHDHTPDRVISVLAILGGVASLIRVGFILYHERRLTDASLGMREADRTERHFAITYLAFAALLGLFGARTFQVSTVEMQMVVAALVVGYAAGVAAGISLRPWIGIPSVVLAVVPVFVMSTLRFDVPHLALSIVLAALLAGGINSMAARYRSETEKITMRRTFASLARRDHLTGLANRLALSERFDELAAAAVRPDEVAVHCLDLDRFKPVNDRHGHPVGDALLVAVAGRLQGLLRNHDIAARLGGDEFMVLQTNMKHRGEAELMAHRIVRVLGEPYRLGDMIISVSASVGYVVADECGEQLDALINCADNALCQVKQRGGGAAGFAGAAGRSPVETLQARV